MPGQLQWVPPVMIFEDFYDVEWFEFPVYH